MTQSHRRDVDVAQLLPRAAVHLGETPRTKRDCIEFLLDRAAATGRVVDHDAARSALFEREAQTATGMGRGVAIPHARTDGVTEPTAAFARSNDGVDFGGPDDGPATLIVLLLVPADVDDADDAHVAALSRLSRALARENVRDRLRSASTPDGVRRAFREVSVA